MNTKGSSCAQGRNSSRRNIIEADSMDILVDGVNPALRAGNLSRDVSMHSDSTFLTNYAGAALVLRNRFLNFATISVATVAFLLLAWLSTHPYRDLLFFRAKLRKSVANAVPYVPYWIPYFGHIVPFSYDCDALLKRIRDRFSFDIYALKLAGSRHYMVTKPNLVAKVLAKNEKDVAYAEVQADMVHLTFGLHCKWKQDFAQNLPNFRKAVITGLMREPALKDIVHSVVQGVALVLPRLLPSSARTPTPGPWGRSSNSNTTEINEADGSIGAIEVDLYPLVRDSLGHCANPAIMGKRFLEDYPTLLEDLWAFDDGFLHLFSGVPTWMPIPIIWRAIKARDRILRNVLSWTRDFTDSLRKNSNSQEFDDVSEVVRQVIHMLGHTAIDEAGRASVLSIVVWALNANANNLAFWLIIRLFSDPDLLSRIRSEIKPFVQAERPNPTKPAHLQLSIQDITSSCPLLKACYLECNRLHSRPVSFRTIANDLILTDDEQAASSPASSISHLLRKNSYIYIPHFLHHLSPSYFPDPETFNPKRFLVISSTTTHNNIEVSKEDSITTGNKITVNPRTLRLYGGGASMCKGRYFAEREVLAFVSAFVTLWDIEDLKGGRVKVPGMVKASATAKPDGVCRVRIRRRV